MLYYFTASLRAHGLLLYCSVLTTIITAAGLYLTFVRHSKFSNANVAAGQGIDAICNMGGIVVIWVE